MAETIRRLVGPLELIHDRAGPSLLRLVRLGVCALWLVKLLLDPLSRLADLPRALLHPVGVLTWCDNATLARLMSGPGLSALWYATFGVLVGCLANRFFAPLATLAAVLLTIYSTVIRSFGPAVHTDIVLLLAVYVLALFAWADVVAARWPKLHSPRTTPWSSAPIIVIVMLLCLSYFFVGLNRALFGGWRLFAGDSMEIFTVDASLRAYYFNTGVGWHVPGWPLVLLLLRSGLPVITLFEISAPLCLVSVRFRWIFIPVMLSFHLLSLVFMNIFFFDDMLLYFLLVDWSRWRPRAAN